MGQRQILLFFLISVFLGALGLVAIPNEAGAVPPSVSLIGASNTNSADFYPFQRKGFYANGLFWVFYSDGSNMVFNSSSDGISWSSPETVRPCTSGEQFSVWFEGASVHYSYSSGIPGTPIYYRKGLLNAAGAIAWGPEQIAVPKGLNVTHSIPCISVDSNGYAWIGYRKVDGANKRPMITKNSKKDGTWLTIAGFPYDLAGWTAAYWMVSPVPLTDGKVLAIYTSHGHLLRSKTWMGSTWLPRVINPNPKIGINYFSAVAEGDDVHVVFLSSTTLLHTKYTYSMNSWGIETKVQPEPVTNTSAPVLSMDSSFNLHLFWAGSPKANHIYYKKNSGGRWDASPLDWGDESAEKLTRNDSLSSLYNADHGLGVFYLTKTASPYYVKFRNGSPSIPPLSVTITAPKDGEAFHSSPISVAGKVSRDAQVTVNGIAASVSKGIFSVTITLREGENPIIVKAEDAYGQKASLEINVTLQTKGKVIGTVIDSSTGFSIPSALVSITDSLNFAKTTLTNTEGKYAISDIASGPFKGSISRDGYTPFPFSGTMSPGQTVSIDASLSPTLPQIRNIRVFDITVDSARIAWETDQPADSLVEYGLTSSYGSSVSDSTLTTNHQIFLRNLSSQTTYHFRIISKNAYGFFSSSGDQSFTTQAPINSITLNILSPQNSATISRGDVKVEGTINNALGYETGVVVNGVLAQVYENQFIANHVPLTEGVNTLTATAKDVKGNTATASITLNGIKSQNYIKITASSESGIVPFETLLTLDSSLDLRKASLVPKGPADVEMLAASEKEYQVKITVEGIYTFTATVTDLRGIVYEDFLTLTILTKAEVENLLRNKWEGMKGMLIGGNIEGALGYFVPAVQDKYRKIFMELGDSKINSIFSNIIEVELDTLSGRVAECGAIRKESGGIYSYPIDFVQDQNGIWRIMGF